MKKVLLTSFVLASLLYGYTKQEFFLGETNEFAERDMLELLQEHLANNKEEIEQRALNYGEKGKEAIKNYKPKGLEPLSPATKDRIFYPDISYTTDRDIVGANGRVLYPKGFKFNPADYVKLSYGMVVIDGTNRQEVEWFKQSGFANQIAYRLLLSDGSFYELNKELKQDVFYLMPEIRKRFDIQKTPSIIKQIENKIQVSEICLPCTLDDNKAKAK